MLSGLDFSSYFIELIYILSCISLCLAMCLALHLAPSLRGIFHLTCVLCLLKLWYENPQPLWKEASFCDLFRYGKEFHVNLLQEKRRSRWILFYLRSYTVDLNMWRLGGKEYERILNSGWPFLKIKVKRKIYLCFKEKCDHMRCFLPWICAFIMSSMFFGLDNVLLADSSFSVNIAYMLIYYCAFSRLFLLVTWSVLYILWNFLVKYQTGKWFYLM